VPITILRAQAAAARLFFGNIAGSRALARSHFPLFRQEEDGCGAKKNCAPRFCPRFAARLSHAV
jgi:hypothetical protein